MIPFKIDWGIAKHYLFIGLALLAFHTVNKWLEADINGSVTFFSRTEDGKIELGKLAVKKKAVAANKNLIELNQGLDGSREIIYKRKYADIFGMGIYLGGGVETTKDGGEHYKVGISISF